MIINFLTLHNFMSYADARLDLTPVSVACLTGLNGSGKSALLDAITWALWEQARASSEELVRLGQSEMWVDICFSLEGQVYRVRRSRQKSYGKSGAISGSRGNLDLQIYEGRQESWLAYHAGNKNGKNGKNGNNGEEASALKWTSLNASSMKETQKRLKELLHMDYETFISSVYLRQGKADEFTTRSANERKQVFADILGLSYFERLQDLCRQEARECKGRIQILEASLGAESEFERTYMQLIENQEELRAGFKSVEDNLNESNKELSQQEDTVSALRLLKVKEENKRARLKELHEDKESLRRSEEELLLQTGKLNKLMQESDSIKAGYGQFIECKTLVEELDLKAARHSDLWSKRMELRSRVAMAQGRMEVELEHLKALLKSKQTREIELAKSCKDKDKISEAYENYRALLQAELEMSRKRESFTALNSRQDELQSLIAESRVRLEAQIQQKEALIEELDELINAGNKLEADQISLKQELLLIDKYEAEFELVEEKGIKVKSQIESLKQQINQLQKHIRDNEEKMQELCRTPDLSNCPLCRAPIVDSKAVLDRYKEDGGNAEKEISDLENRIAGLTTERDSLRQQYSELRKRLSERKLLDMKIGQFNERKSAWERALANRDSLKSELEASKQMLSSNGFAPVEKESLIRVKAELAKLDFDPIVFSSFQAQMRAQRHLEFRYQQVQKDLKEQADLLEELPVLANRIEEMGRALAAGDFSPEERSEIESLDKSIAELSYDKNFHQRLKQQLAELMHFAEKAKEVERAQRELPDLERSQKEISSLVLFRKQEIERLEEELEDYATRLLKMPAEEEKLEALRKEQADLIKEKERLDKNMLLVQTQLHQLDADRTQLDTKKKQVADSINEMGEYAVLAEAFGKKGIQAIIIENVIPEIEVEANRILSRLSDNRMHLALLTQQRSRQGTPIETLEIIIADELGTRSYELYSGGEAFKVNFALRVAMSRLLARRAGAKLETLIIDEGFGSQDEYSRHKLIQAIASIQQDFARIIVVTHIGEVKDMFPVQIAVSKEEGVSRVALNV